MKISSSLIALSAVLLVLTALLAVGGWTATIGPTATAGLACFACALQLNASLRRFAFTAWVLVFVAAAMSYPSVFLAWGGFELKRLMVPLMQIIMFGMGTTLSIGDFARVLTMPKAVLTGIVLQFAVMPFIGAIIALTFGFEPAVAAGIILVGACPGGVASNVMAYLARGNVALSVAMTTGSTLVSPLMTPLMMKLLAGQLIPVAFVAMMIAIITMIIVPIVAGLVASKLLQTLGLRGDWLDRILSAMAMAAICLIIAIITSLSRDKLLGVGLALIVAVVLHNGLGYVLGYWGARMMGLDESTCRTVAIEVGLQNGGMASGLAINVIGDANTALAAAVFGPWMNISGSMLATWWRGRPLPERPVA